MTLTVAGGLDGYPVGALCGICLVFPSQLDWGYGVWEEDHRAEVPCYGTNVRDTPATWPAPAGADPGHLAEVCLVCQASHEFRPPSSSCTSGRWSHP